MGDQPDRAAGLDGTQLLVIADQPHIGAAAQGVADDLVQGVGARHGGLVDDQDVAGTEVELTLGETELQGGGDLVQSVWGGVDGLAKFLGGAGVPSRYTIVNSTRTVQVLDISHRRDAYR